MTAAAMLAAGQAGSPMPLVSIVTPAYNEEQLLPECIESVLAQTYPHWDHTIVDNCSTDRTLQIAQDYAAADPRIRVRRNASFVPVVANHNIAVRQVSAESKYCKVVAADDWIFPQCLEMMVRVAEDHPTVAVVGAYRIVGSRLDPVGLPFPATVAPGRDVCRTFLLGGDYLFGAPTSLLFRADVVRGRDPFFAEPDLHADILACLECLDGRDFGFVHQLLTVERIRENSLQADVRKHNLYLAEKLDAVLKFGPRYLDDQELRQAIEIVLRAYYDYLGGQLYHRRRDREFWEIHRQRLARLGHPLRRRRLLARATIHGARATARRLRPWR